MVNSFTSVITWFVGIFQDLISWFLDTTSTTKILLFVAPVFVIAGLYVLFDFVIPMFYDLPQWKINKQVVVMSPKNQLNLKPNLHLIPRRSYKLIPRKFYSRIGAKIHSFKGNDIKSFKSDKIQSYNTRDIKSFRSEEIRSFKVNDIKALKPEEMRSFKVNDIKALKPEEIRSFKFNDIRALKPEEMRSFKVNDIKPLKVSDIRPVSISSRIISGSTDKLKISGVNNLRVASPSFRINTSHDLTKLGDLSVANIQSAIVSHKEAKFDGYTVSGDNQEPHTSSTSGGDGGSYGDW